MSNFISFLVGSVFGAYISQNYKIPDVRLAINHILLKIDEIEKSSRTEEDNYDKNDKNK